MRAILEAMKRYTMKLEDFEDEQEWKKCLDMIRSIDLATSTGVSLASYKVPDDLSDIGTRRYIGQNDKGQAQDHHAQKIREFVQFVTAVLDNDGLPEDAEMKYTLRECGYSICDKRLSQHMHHQSSNYLMNLCHAICQAAGPPFYHYQPQPLVVFHCWRPEQPSMAEILFSQASGAYYEFGTGFCHARAGESIASAHSISGDQWETWRSVMLKSAHLEENAQWNEQFYHQKMQEDKDAMEASDAELRQQFATMTDREQAKAVLQELETRTVGKQMQKLLMMAGAADSRRQTLELLTKATDVLAESVEDYCHSMDEFEQSLEDIKPDYAKGTIDMSQFEI